MSHKRPSALADVTSMGRSDASGGLDLMLAIHHTYSFPRHFHETYVVQVVETGVDKFFCRGAFHEAGAGAVVCPQSRRSPHRRTGARAVATLP